LVKNAKAKSTTFLLLYTRGVAMATSKPRKLDVGTMLQNNPKAQPRAVKPSIGCLTYRRGFAILQSSRCLEKTRENVGSVLYVKWKVRKNLKKVKTMFSSNSMIPHDRNTFANIIFGTT
jgi:hypothetical protein